MKRTLLLLAIACMGWANSNARDTMSLAGAWRFEADPMGFGMTDGSEVFLKTDLPETVILPGSMDTNGKGLPTSVSRIDRLTRLFEYSGKAWYQREVVIPDDWKDQSIELLLERCHWTVTVYVDGQRAGTDDRLSTPDRFDVTEWMTPGQHVLTLCVDNTVKYDMDTWTHGLTEYTQTNWNGVVGEMTLTARPKAHILAADIYPHLDAATAELRLTATEAARSGGSLSVRVKDDAGTTVYASPSMPWVGADTCLQVPMGKHFKQWDEFSPSLYTLEAVLQTEEGCDTVWQTFGMREVRQGDHHVQLNGHDIHLRGTLECCVFPLTGYPSTDVGEWARIMDVLKDYGMNHIRFHSWCPPEAAFVAADQAGVYLQVELPLWLKNAGAEPARRDFFEKELRDILKVYGNHPSFLLYCNGNELGGDFNVLEDLVQKGQQADSRHLYSASTARTHVASDQFYVSHNTSKGGLTVYNGWPDTSWDKSKTADIDVPAIAHEAGQRCMYPNFKEIEKYTGVLQPRNFLVFQERLKENGMLWQADDFFKATGAHTVLQYREVHEALLRTPNMAGFQLLGLTDFPGQGTALVGILDPFWDSKGLVTPDVWRRSCNSRVLLARMKGRVWEEGSSVPVQFDLYNFRPEAVKGKVQWQLKDEQGMVVSQGSLKMPAVEPYRTDSLGCITLTIPTTGKAQKYVLEARLADGTMNDWNFWSCPSDADETAGAEVVTEWAEARSRLEAGQQVLFMPAKPNGRRTHFDSHFWNPVMFRWNPMIVGTRIEAGHPAFGDFPTSYYADWQWSDILNHATALDLTDLRTVTPLIQSVDTYEFNRKLGVAFEAQVGKGRLFVLCVDAVAGSDKARPASRQLIRSVKEYVASDAFAPTATLATYQLDALFAQ